MWNRGGYDGRVPPTSPRVASRHGNEWRPMVFIIADMLLNILLDNKLARHDVMFSIAFVNKYNCNTT